MADEFSDILGGNWRGLIYLHSRDDKIDCYREEYCLSPRPSIRLRRASWQIVNNSFPEKLVSVTAWGLNRSSFSGQDRHPNLLASYLQVEERNRQTGNSCGPCVGSTDLITEPEQIKGAEELLNDNIFYAVVLDPALQGDWAPHQCVIALPKVA